jgi:SAM-dependent methyltransferase
MTRSESTYGRFAAFYDLLYEQGRGHDYEAQATEVRRLIRSKAPKARSLLDVACGTGGHLAVLSKWYEVAGLDRSPEMVKLARRRNPRVTIHLADLADFQLDRQFDAVTCLFSSIAYVRTLPRLRKAVRTMRRHLAPGGLLVIDGWTGPADWKPGTTHVHAAENEGVKIARVNRSSRRGDVGILDWHFLVATRDKIEHFTERHEVGLFTRAEYLGAMTDAGLRADLLRGKALAGRDRYVGVAPQGKDGLINGS